MTVAAYKRKWFDELHAELRAKGLSDTAIARQMGVSRSYFSQVKAADTIGDEFIDRMAQSFGKKFIPQVKPEQGKGSADTVTVSAADFAELVRQVKLQGHLLSAVLDRLPKP